MFLGKKVSITEKKLPTVVRMLLQWPRDSRGSRGIRAAELAPTSPPALVMWRWEDAISSQAWRTMDLLVDIYSQACEDTVWEDPSPPQKVYENTEA